MEGLRVKLPDALHMVCVRRPERTKNSADREPQPEARSSQVWERDQGHGCQLPLLQSGSMEHPC